MKPFVIWLVLVFIVFGAISGVYHLYLSNSPHKVLVAIDSSFSMKAVWSQVPSILRQLEERRYTTFSLVTEKNKIHSWAPALQLGALIPYAPRDFAKLIGNGQYPEIGEAQQKYLITDPEGAQNNNFKGWTVIQLNP
jgi:hypothetical protein